MAFQILVIRRIVWIPSFKQLWETNHFLKLPKSPVLLLLSSIIELLTKSRGLDLFFKHTRESVYLCTILLGEFDGDFSSDSVKDILYSSSNWSKTSMISQSVLHWSRDEPPSVTDKYSWSLVLEISATVSILTLCYQPLHLLVQSNFHDEWVVC